MRDIMRLVERIATDGEPVPDMLYHGTSPAAWKQISDADEMVAGEKGISFTTDWHAAARYALQAAERAGEEYGVVISFDGNDLAHEHLIAPGGAGDMPHAAAEWHVTKPVMHNINRFVKGAEKAHW